MKILLNGIGRNFDEFVCRELGFGEEICAERQLAFSIEMALDEVSGAFRALFDNFVGEQEEDDLRTDYSAAIPAIVEASYARFSRMATDYPESLCAVLRDNLPQELIWSAIMDTNLGRRLFSINSLDEVTLIDGNLKLAGTAFAIVPSVPSPVSADESGPKEGE